MKTQQAISGTNAATYELMDPQLYSNNKASHLYDMSVMNCPNLKEVRQQFFDEVVEDFPIDDKPLGGQRLDCVVQQQERAVLGHAVLALNPGQQSRK